MPWLAGDPEQAALVGINFPQHDPGAVTARRHFTGTLAGVVGIVGEGLSCIVCTVAFVNGEPGGRDDAHATPVGVGNVHGLLQLPLCGAVAAGLDHLRVAVIKKALSLD